MKAMRIAIGLGVLSVWLASPAMGNSLLVSDSGGALGYGYGYSAWDNMTAALNAQFSTVTVVPNFQNLALMLGYDRLWLDQRWTSGSLTATEISNIGAFIATGRRVVLMGEND